MGKNLKRLDNHLSRKHKGMTRAMNDRQPLNLQEKTHITCLLPHCGKDVLHLSHHLRNKHSNMSVNEYKTVVGKGQKSSNSVIVTATPREERDETKFKEANAKNERKPERNKKEERIEAEDSEVLASDSDQEGSSAGYKERGDREREEKIAESDTSDTEVNSQFDMDLQDGYTDEMLRYLVHNTTPDGVRFFLAALRSGTTVVQFSRSRLCRDALGERDLPMLQCIYRQYLTSYYRLQKYYPYPENDMIHSCAACDATERGKCSCPILPKSFYVFCRQKCSGDWHCAKCVNFDRGPSHACFDFFHCEICHDRYVTSTKLQP